MRNISLAAALAAIFVAAPARAAESGLTVGLRAAYGAPIGKVGTVTGGSSVSLSQVYAGSVPLWIEAGWQFDPHWSAGLYFQYAPASTASDFENLMRASFLSQGFSNIGDFGGSAKLLGIQGAYRFMPETSFAPWLGAGVGYEWASQTFRATESTSGIPLDLSNSMSGIDVILQAGGDYRAAPRFTVGPFAALAFGWYRSMTVEGSAMGQSASQSFDFTEKKMHAWLQFGLRGTFDVFP